jgi:hypothetical protein
MYVRRSNCFWHRTRAQLLLQHRDPLGEKDARRPTLAPLNTSGTYDPGDDQSAIYRVVFPNLVEINANMCPAPALTSTLSHGANLG